MIMNVSTYSPVVVVSWGDTSGGSISSVSSNRLLLLAGGPGSAGKLLTDTLLGHSVNT